MPKARQADLPGMEDRKMKDVHEAALTYAEARDERIAASAPEIEAKGTLLDLMKKHKIERYHFDNVEVLLVHEKENVKVKISPQEGTEPDDKTNGMPRLPKKQRKAVEAK